MSRTSDPVDPLLGYTLFPKAKLPSTTDPSNPFDFDHNLQAINLHLKSTTASLSGPLKDHAKNILSGASGFQQANMSQALKHQNGEVLPNAAENHRERRPALGRKRTRFSMKPNYRQPDISLGSKFNSKKYKDPNDFFTAFEIDENANRELEKLMGGAVLDGDEQTRARRPGISRRPVKYKHHISSLYNKIMENKISTEETFETGILSPLKHGSQTESHEKVALDEMDLAGSKVEEDNKWNSEVLDELLSQPTEDLEGNGATRLVKAMLNIKIFEVDSLQDFPDTQKADLKSLRKNVLKPRSVKPRQGSVGLINLASPRPPKSPLVLLPDLAKSLSSSSKDAFSASDIDQSPANPSSVGNRNKQFGWIDILGQNMISDKLYSPLIKQSDKTEGTKTCEVAIKKFTCASERSKRDSLSKPGDVDMEDETGGSKIMSEASSMSEDDTCTRANGVDNSEKVEDKLQEEADPEVNAADSKFDSAHSQVVDDVIDSDEIQEEYDVQEAIPEDNVVDSNLENLNGAQSQYSDTVMNYDVVQEQDKLQDAVAGAEHGSDAADAAVEKLNDAPSQLDQLHSAPVEEHPMDGLSRNIDVGLEKQNEIIQEHSGASLNKPIEANSQSRRKQKNKEVPKRQSPAGVSLNKPIEVNSWSHRKQKNKEVPKRKSLAGSWESGVRRSTRRRIRPLEYWKGERLLIGRIDNGLPTVIGVKKYASPEKGEGKAPMKVEYYVEDDEQKMLVDLISLH